MSYLVDEKAFEKKVLSVAEAKFPFSRKIENISIDGIERDGLFITKDIVHYLECTVSKKGSKAAKDIGKLDSLKIKLERKYNLPVGLWFITRDDPSPEQVKVANNSKNQIRILSLNGFISTIFDAHTYIRVRDNHEFGSVNFKIDGQKVVNDGYIPIKLADIGKKDKLWDSEEITSHLVNGEKFLILGQFGVGKSMTLRDIYYKLVSLFIKNNINKFPLYINLRDHDGQSDPSEIIIRHATRIGYPNPFELVQAWKGGFIIPILDGFDEIATIGYANKNTRLQDIRYRSLKAIREFTSQCESDNGLILAGRSNYFDKDEELRKLLGVTSDYNLLSIDDFTTEQAQSFLSSHNLDIIIPAWVPTKPLLLGYLIAKKILHEIPDNGYGPSLGWDILLDKIAEREAAIDSGVMPNDIRHIIEILASRVRSFVSELGPITEEDLKIAFNDVVGYDPDDKGINILQRLPGLGSQASDGSRQFIDENFASAAKAGYVARFALDPYNLDVDRGVANWGKSLDDLGLKVLEHIVVTKYCLAEGQWKASVNYAINNNMDILAFDIYYAGRDNFKGWQDGIIEFSGFSVQSYELNDEIEESLISFRDIYVGVLTVDSLTNSDKWPKFKECPIEFVEGIKSELQLPTDKFFDCIFNKFEKDELTNSYLLSLDIPTAVSVGYTILKKLYIQRGTGRRESALMRGLSHNEKRYVPDVLKVLAKEEFTVLNSGPTSNKVWLPVKSKKRKVLEIISSKDINDNLSKLLSKI